jgi:hypothetical protein
MILIFFALGHADSWSLVGLGAAESSSSIQADSSGQVIPTRRVAYQRGRSSGGLTVRWIGQDGQDHVGPHNRLEPSDVQDIHLVLGGLDPRREVVVVDVMGQGGDQWQYQAQTSSWRAELKRKKGSPTADLFIEPSRVEAGRSFHVVVRYDDGTTVATELRGRKADHQLRMASAALQARWVGQDRQDWTGVGPSVGPDGVQDVRIHLSKLSAKVSVKSIRIEGPAAARWEFGTNPQLLANAELIRDIKDPSQGDLFFQPGRDLNGQRIKLTVLYESEKRDGTTLVAARCDAALRMPQTPLPRVEERAVTAKWLGQDDSGSRPGDLRVVVSGLPASRRIAAVVLSDPVQGLWAYRASERASVPTDPEAKPLDVTLGSDRTSATLSFPPYRDERADIFTVRLVYADGRMSVAHFPGGPCDLGRRAAAPAPSRIEAKPGDDLQALADRYGTMVLSKGTYRLRHPLVLSRPLTLTAAEGATLSFAQDAADPAWTTAIKIHCGNTTLNGFAVRFEGAIRWNNDVSWGPAVIGMTDNLDQGHDELKVNLAFTHLDLEIPPVENRGGWVEAPRLIRLVRAEDGVIAGNILRGGPIEFFGGPWEIRDNDFRGTPPGTYSHSVFAGHGVHDILVHGNRAASPEPSGKTWRFLVLTGRGANDRVERNTIEGIGARDGDTIPWSNEPEIILTEGYHLKYEGRVLALAPDGKLVRVGRPQGQPVRTGDGIALLDGPQAGHWRRVVQAIDPSTYLVDPPIPTGTEVVSICTGFVSEVFQENRIDIRGGRRSDPIVLAGNHFGTRVVKNHLLGGDRALRITAFPSEVPLIWGWTHSPFLEAVIEGNILEDAQNGSVVGVEHSQYIKSNKGRTYMSVRLDQNIIRWTEPFLNRLGRERSTTKEPLAGLTIGFADSHDPGELLVTAAGNRLDAPADYRAVPALWIRAANYNSQRLLNRRLRLASSGTPSSSGRREVDTRPGLSIR